MIGLAVSFVFALLFTGITIRLAFGGFDASVVVALGMTLALWWQVFRRLKRGVGL
jgi:hypothetical protein